MMSDKQHYGSKAFIALGRAIANKKVFEEVLEKDSIALAGLIQTVNIAIEELQNLFSLVDLHSALYGASLAQYPKTSDEAVQRVEKILNETRDESSES